MNRFFKTKYLLFAILIIGFFLRIYKPQELFLYSHDQDLAGWFVKDILVNKHLRLIGQETSTQGIFIGPLFYYLLVPFYLVSGMDPIGGVFLVSIIGLAAIYSFFFVFKRVFDERTGLIAALIYSVSYFAVYNDREVVPTMPVILWSVWFLYALNLILKGKQKLGFVLSGALLALTWNFNVALVLLAPLILISLFLSKKRLDWKSALWGLVFLVIFSSPFILFEFKHNFVQVRSLISSFTTDQHDIVSGLDKVVRTIHLSSKNVTGILWGSVVNIKYEITFYASLAILGLLSLKKIISGKISLLFWSWIIIYLAFFSFYSKVLSEYYLNGMNVVWIAVFAVSISYFLKSKKYKSFGFLLIMFFVFINFYRFFTVNINRSGYVERKGIVGLIKEDLGKHGYPCFAISYITDPGYNLGYRYFFWLVDLHVTKPSSGSPVYTIVYPLKPIFQEDIAIGSIGLIYPDYSRYTKESVEKSCSGENVNLIEPMFGFTN